MAKVPDSSSKRAQFNRAAAQSSGTSFGFDTGLTDEAYESGYVNSDPSNLMGVRNMFGGMGSGSGFFDQETIMHTEYLDTDTDEEQAAKVAALEALGLDPSKDYALRYYRSDAERQEQFEGRQTPGFTSTPGKMAGLTDIPTSSTNFQRPRTVAAGWEENGPDDYERGTLTVVFRDGTPYNFYDVPRSVWIKFHDAISKGRSFLNRANSKQAIDGTLLRYEHGPADTSQMSEEMRRMVYQAARTQQIYYRNPVTGKGHYQVAYTTKKNPTKRDKVVGYDKATGHAIVRKRQRTIGTPQNPTRSNPNPKINKQIAKAGKNPNQNAGKNPNQK